MGERGAHNEPATPDDIAEMKALVKAAVRAGALGFSTSRTIAHIAIDGEPVPGTYAAEDELFGIGAALGELGTGVFELAPDGLGRRGHHRPGQGGRLDAPPLGRHRPAGDLRAAPGRRRPGPVARADGRVAAGRRRGRRPVAPGGGPGHRPAVGPPHHLLAVRHDPGLPAAQGQANLSPADLLAALRDPEVRRVDRRVGAAPTTPPRERMRKSYDSTFVLGTPPDYEPGPERSLASMAAAAGRTPLDVAYDAMLGRRRPRPCSTCPILNYSSGSLDPTREMLLHPRAALGLADGGAHCGVICDAGQPTFMLSYWTRDRTQGEKLPLEWVVRKQTRDTARLYGLGDRGTIEPGMVGRPQRHRLRAPPAGQPRSWSTTCRPAASGWCSGPPATRPPSSPASTTFADGEDTGARPVISAVPVTARPRGLGCSTPAVRRLASVAMDSDCTSPTPASSPKGPGSSGSPRPPRPPASTRCGCSTTCSRRPTSSRSTPTPPTART